MSALDWVSSRPCRFVPKKTAPGTYCIGGCVGVRVGVDVMEKRKNRTPNNGRPARNLVAHTDWDVSNLTFI
jgi:hypothetical protein